MSQKYPMSGHRHTSLVIFDDIKPETKEVTRLIATQCLAFCGLKRTEIHHMFLNNFHIHESQHKTLREYFILHWSGSKLSERLHEGMIHSYGHDFNVIYHNCNPFAAKKSECIKLSFRAAIPELDIPNYVLIKLDDKSNKELNEQNRINLLIGETE